MAGNPEGSMSDKPVDQKEKKEGQQPGPDAANGAKVEGARVVSGQQAMLDRLDADQLDDKKKDKIDQKYEAKPFTPEELAKKTKGLPEIAIAGNEKLIAELKAKFKEGSGKDMEHGDNQYKSESGDYQYVLLFDGTRKPPERLFRSKDKNAEAKAEIDLNDAVGSMLKPYNELPANDKEFKSTVTELSGKVKKHGDSQMTGIVKDGVKVGWVLLKDDDAKDTKGWRVFKGTPV